MRIFNQITKGYQKLILCAVIIENVSDFVAKWHKNTIYMLIMNKSYFFILMQNKFYFHFNEL